MGSKWISTTLGDIAQNESGAVDGPFGSNLPASSYVVSGIPVIRGSNLSIGLTRFRSDDFVYVSEETFKKLKRSECLPEDILFTKKGTLGQTGIVPSDGKYSHYLLSSNQMRLRVDRNQALPDYVYYFVSSKRSLEKIKRESESTGVPKINLDYLKKFKITLPPLDEQRRIVHLLKVLDEKIELNRQMNETLEQMAQALFKSWFVDFGPVIDNALDAGNPIPEELEARAEQRKQLRDAEAQGEASAPSLPDEIRALFPSEFELTDEMGWIPKGWKIESINDATELIIDHRGKTPKKLGSDWCGYGYPAISAKNIKSGRLVNRDSIRFVDHDLYQKWMKDPIQPGDIALTSEAPLGELYYFSEKCDYLLSQRLYGLRADHEKCSGAYLYFWLKSDLAWQDLESRATGTTVVGIRQSELRKVKVLIPSANVMDCFSCQASAFLKRVEKQEQQIEQLEKIRDSLLPKLISGELQIPDAEQQIAEALS